jgi:hypothetical protein
MSPILHSMCAVSPSADGIHIPFGTSKTSDVKHRVPARWEGASTTFTTAVHLGLVAWGFTERKAVTLRWKTDYSRARRGGCSMQYASRQTVWTWHRRRRRLHAKAAKRCNVALASRVRASQSVLPQLRYVLAVAFVVVYKHGMALVDSSCIHSTPFVVAARMSKNI